MGQVATLTFGDCATGLLGDPATLGGSATFTVTGVAGDPITGTYALATSVDAVDLTVTWGDGASHVIGGFAFLRDAVPAGVVEQSSSPPGSGLTLTEGAGAEVTEVRLEAFSIRSTRAESGAFTLASAGDSLTVVASGIASPLAVDVSAAVSGTEPAPPETGDLRVEASDATSVGLHLATGGVVTLALDSDGDGVVDSTIPTTWDVLD